ncbi:hypothetical protein DFR57_11057 [Saliterribacillus persicus]|uniref:Uncharacterized protein n=1 Tax=Saliterribacillus persicus TaxID=930114 RepID=A0A368XD20_9BACI|nr:hypothetical protein DFR57_11057 [Saliterribacillus persicus]
MNLLKRNKLQRIISIVLISTILFWTAFPIVSYASFITPGQAINPGQAITPGDPISGGEFIAPGEVYEYGIAIEDGQKLGTSNNWNSEQSIIQRNSFTGGVYIIPNTPWQPSFFQFDSTPISSGIKVAGERADSTVEGEANGNSVDSRNLVDSGQNGANANVGGSESDDGLAVDGGIESSNNNGQAPYATGNTSLGHILDGNGFLTGSIMNGNSTNENGTSGNSTSQNDSESEENNISLLNAAFSTTDDSKGFLGQVKGFLTDTKTYIFDFGDNIAQGVTSIYAGFDFNEKADGYYGVKGKNKLNNRAANWFYDRYRQYSFEGKDVQFGPQSRRIGETRYNAFLRSKSIGGTGGLLKNIATSTKSALNSSWNLGSRSFYKPSNMAKLGGPVGIILTSFDSIYEHTQKKDEFEITDFAASLTTDVAIGVASTAIGSIASSAAAGAVAGSMVPVAGTIVGATFGLLVGIFTTYLINGTSIGRRVKDAVTNTVKKGYDGVAKGAKWAANGISSGFSKIGALFGG